MDQQQNHLSCRPIIHFMQWLQHYIGKTEHNQEKRIYEHKWSIKTNIRAQTHTQFFPSHTNQTHTLQKILKTTRICGHFQNNPYKTTSRFLPNLTIPGEHHTKQNQNRKWIKKQKTNFFSLCATILLRILSFPLSLYLLAHP